VDILAAKISPPDLGKCNLRVSSPKSPGADCPRGARVSAPGLSAPKVRYTPLPINREGNSTGLQAQTEMAAIAGSFRIQSSLLAMKATLGADPPPTWYPTVTVCPSPMSPILCTKGQWTVSEDEMLKIAIAKLGARKWTRVSALVAGRSSKQCRERWHNHLDPDIDKSEFTACEESIVRTQYHLMGPRWSEMSRLLTGRTDGSIKNLFNSRIRRDLPTDAFRSPDAADGKKQSRVATPCTKYCKRRLNTERVTFDFDNDSTKTSFLCDDNLGLGPLFARPEMPPRVLERDKAAASDLESFFDIDELRTPSPVSMSIEEEVGELMLPPSLDCMQRNNITFTTVPRGMVARNHCNKSIGVHIAHNNPFTVAGREFAEINSMLARPLTKRKRGCAFTVQL